MVNQRQTIKTGPDGYAKFQVSDGSTFEVFPNYRSDLPQDVRYRRPAQCLDGQGQSLYPALPGIPNPNNVTTPTALISVRGTIFDVDVQDLEGTTFVTLDEGSGRCAASAGGFGHRPPASRRDRPGAAQHARCFRWRTIAVSSSRQMLKGLEDAVRRRSTSVPAIRRRRWHADAVGSGGGVQGDKGKNTGQHHRTGTGTGAPTGAPPAPPPPPPPGGGGDA